MQTFKAFKYAIAVAAMAVAGSAFAAPISVGFNFIPFNLILTSNTGDITTSTFVTASQGPGGGFYQVNGIDPATANNINVVLGQQVSFLTNPMNLVVGANFTKTFTTSLGTFTENLTVDTVATGPGSRSITAIGTISGGFAGFDPTPVFFSAAYTQNGGAGAQINASFNNSTVNPTLVPEPGSLALVGLALVGLAAAQRSKKAKKA